MLLGHYMMPVGHFPSPGDIRCGLHMSTCHNGYMEIFAARLKSARQAKQLTQRELGARVGMDQGHISRLEHGGKGLSTEHLQALARELGVSTSYLLGEDSQEDGASYTAGAPRFVNLLQDYEAPAGLRSLASDNALVSALGVTEREMEALASIKLPGEATKDGYVQLLVTIRAIARDDFRVES